MHVLVSKCFPFFAAHMSGIQHFMSVDGLFDFYKGTPQTARTVGIMEQKSWRVWGR